MLADGRTVPDGEVITTDACIIGAGPAGITLAKELGAEGIDVVLLERGDAQWTATHPEPTTAVNVGVPYNIPESRAFGLGGSIHKWNVESPLGGGLGRLRELDPSDFEHREWIPNSGWPFSKEHLQPFYTRARSIFDCDWPSDRPEELLEGELSDSPFLDSEGFVRTRLFFFANPAVFASQYKRALENSVNVMVLTNSTVVDVRCDDVESRVSSARVAVSAGRGFNVKARAYVLAAGGIENPRVLLASRSRHAAGLGNQYDLVGRFFMEHPHYASGLITPSNSDLFDDLTSYAVHVRDGLVMQKKYTLDDRVVHRECLAGCAFLLHAQPMGDLVRRLRYDERASSSLRSLGQVRKAVRRRGLAGVPAPEMLRIARGTPHLVREMTARAADHIGRWAGLQRYSQPSLFRIEAMAEQIPNPDSRVELHSRKDDLGVPIAQLRWQLSDQNIDSIRRSQELLGQALSAGGDHKVESLVNRRSLPPGLHGGNHHMGTTRMHRSPTQGVVDENCRVHETENLFIAGSSVFPTSGYANPTLTILALAIRLSDHMKRMLRA